MKTLMIESLQPERLLELSKLFKNENSKCYLKDNFVYCEVDETNKEEYISVILNLSVLFLLDYVHACKLCKTDKQISYVSSHFIQNPNYRYAIAIDLYSYFENNSVLKENSYFLFNMNALKEDINVILRHLKKAEAFETEKKNARATIKNLGKKLKDYKELFLIEDSDYGFTLVSNSGEHINTDSLEDEFGIMFKIDEALEIEKYIATFVALTCALLNTQVLNIEDSFLCIYEDIASVLTAINHDLEINICSKA